ncbi:MAG: hypothetical protein HY925_10275 [Elusimicrobia bacterium]|nr:hypothetical protein [Elusimicrobiota bacterium]
MSRATRAFLSAFLALAFLGRGAAAFCPPKAESHDCCDESAPKAPPPSCEEMTCCRALPVAAVSVAAPAPPLVAALSSAPAPISPEGRARVIPASYSGGPPCSPSDSASSRAPPVLLG